MSPSIKTTFEIVTPESAEQGDFAETGWVDKEGYDCSPEAFGEMEDTPVEVAMKFLSDNGPLEASSSHFHKGLWYTQSDARCDRAFFEKSEDYRESYRLDGFTEDQEREIFARVTDRGSK